jgi:hypothetical protein
VTIAPPRHAPVRGASRLRGRLVLSGSAVLLLALAWLLVTAWLARGELTHAQQSLLRARQDAVAQRFAPALAEAADAGRAAHKARTLSSGPVWALAGAVPWFGDTPAAVSTAADQADILASDVLPRVLRDAQAAAPARLRTSADTLDLAPLVLAGPDLARAEGQLVAAEAALSGGPGLLPPVRDSLDRFRTSVHDLADTVHAASLAARLLPPMLGADGPRTYLLAFQNPAESRATGGLVGGYGVLRADHGHLSVSTLGTDSDLKGLTKLPASLGADYRALYGDDPALWVNSNESANFPYGAQIWLAAWRAQFGQQLDGVLALDPEVLSALLRVTGPATLPSGQAITADTVVAETMQDAYVRFAAQPAQRKAYLTQVSAAVVDRLLGSRADPEGLVKALGAAAGDRRLLLYSDHPAEQRLLATQPVAGTLPAGPGPSAFVAVNNAAGGKLDYYLDRAVTYHGTACTLGGQRTTELELTLTNAVPAEASLPDYVVGVLGNKAAPGHRNDNRVTAGFWLTPGAQVGQVLVDGRPVTFGLGRDAGHPTVLTTVTLPPQVPVHVTVRLQEPATADVAHLTVQPLVRQPRVEVDVPACR